MRSRIVAVAMLSAARVTASAAGLAIDIRDYEGEAMLVLDAAATEAADNTLDVSLDHSEDGVTWSAVPDVAFDPVTNAAASYQTARFGADGLGRYLRATDTLAGTTPAVVRALTLIGEAKYS